MKGPVGSSTCTLTRASRPDTLVRTRRWTPAPESPGLTRTSAAGGCDGAIQSFPAAVTPSRRATFTAAATRPRVARTCRVTASRPGANRARSEALARVRSERDSLRPGASRRPSGRRTRGRRRRSRATGSTGRAGRSTPPRCPTPRTTTSPPSAGTARRPDHPLVRVEDGALRGVRPWSQPSAPATVTDGSRRLRGGPPAAHRPDRSARSGSSARRVRSTRYARRARPGRCGECRGRRDGEQVGRDALADRGPGAAQLGVGRRDLGRGSLHLGAAGPTADVAATAPPASTTTATANKACRGPVRAVMTPPSTAGVGRLRVGAARTIVTSTATACAATHHAR